MTEVVINYGRGGGGSWEKRLIENKWVKELNELNCTKEEFVPGNALNPTYKMEKKTKVDFLIFLVLNKFLLLFLTLQNR